VLIRLQCSMLAMVADGVTHTVLRERTDALASRFPADGKLRDRIYRLADEGAQWWPKPVKRGQTVNGVKVGESEHMENCGLCGVVCPSGRNEAGQLLMRRDKDGTPFHNLAIDARGACWWIVWRQRRAVA
jgi:hypothetical protein